MESNFAFFFFHTCVRFDLFRTRCDEICDRFILDFVRIQFMFLFPFCSNIIIVFVWVNSKYNAIGFAIRPKMDSELKDFEVFKHGS